MTTWIAAHRKAIAAFLSALGGLCAFIASHAEWGAWAQWAGIAVLVLGAAGVYQVPNKPAGPPAALPAPTNVNVRPTGGIT